VDHYEGNLILSQLELVTLALECLHRRETHQHLRGDHSYALMGLVRIRPKIDASDTAFQAFAR
jgi:polysaccharide pyruvyl transferase WcaK-like protein